MSGSDRVPIGTGRKAHRSRKRTNDHHRNIGMMSSQISGPCVVAQLQPVFLQRCFRVGSLQQELVGLAQPAKRFLALRVFSTATTIKHRLLVAQ